MLNRLLLGKGLLSLALVAGAAVSVGVDANHTHLVNPEWHPHAIFHNALMLILLCGVSLLALWLLWRRSAEPAVGIAVAAWVPVIFWTPFFFITRLLPQSSLNATGEKLPELAGITVYPNLVAAAVVLAIASLGLLLARSGLAKSGPG